MCCCRRVIIMHRCGACGTYGKEPTVSVPFRDMLDRVFFCFVCSSLFSWQQLKLFRVFCVYKRYSYLQLGCSKAQEVAMLKYAEQQVGKPFSQIAMARSLLYPRRTTEKDWCACRLQSSTCLYVCCVCVCVKFATLVVVVVFFVLVLQVLCRAGVCNTSKRWFDGQHFESWSCYSRISAFNVCLQRRYHRVRVSK